ncbi:MAG: thioredoxin family protein [Planctomycetota bacterium]
MKHNQAKVLWKVLLISVLILAVAAVIIVKQYHRSFQTAGIKPEESAVNPLDRALKTGRPVLADFGRGTCIPCKAMKPILDELSAAYKGRAEIFIFDIDKYSELTEQYAVNMIPTQIFFNKSGQEVWRHEGFLEKDLIIEKLNELGVN